MNLRLNKPYKTIWWSIPLILGLALIQFNSTMDIQMHDTYFVIPSFQIGILCSIILGIIGFLYWSSRRKELIHWMTFLHVLITITTFTLLVIIGLIWKKVILSNVGLYTIVNRIVLVTILISISIQFIFVLNLIISLIRNKEKK